jgi:hypothetical protein
LSGVFFVSDAIQIEAALAAPILAAVPGLSAEREARLEHLKTAINSAFAGARHYKKNVEASLHYCIRQGRRLNEVKRIGGHGRFVEWVEKNCPFGQRTANTYMTLDTESIEVAVTANFGMVATAEALTRRRDRKAAAKERQHKVEERRGILDSYALLPLSEKRKLPLGVRNKFKRRIRFADIRAERERQRQRRARDYQERGLPDLTQTRPHQDSEALFIKFKNDEDQFVYFYMWLPEHAHAQASATIGAASHGRWSGSAALKYHWVLSGYDGNRLIRCKATYEEQTWEQVQETLSELSRTMTQVSEITKLDRDPARTEILEHWRITTTRRKPKLSIEDLDKFIEEATRSGDIREAAKEWFNMEE